MIKTKNAKASVATKASNGTEQFIPLNRLKKSPRNARKTPHPSADIEALAASIKAHGMLQAPVVEPEMKDGKPTGFYLVTIGEGRRQAQLLRVKRKEIAKTEPIRCTIETAHDAFEISLAENAVRSPMHPADQFEAFHLLSTEQGLSAEDIGAKFGVTPAVVRQRLKLANVNPALIEAYREGHLTLEQLAANSNAMPSSRLRLARMDSSRGSRSWLSWPFETAGVSSASAPVPLPIILDRSYRHHVRYDAQDGLRLRKCRVCAARARVRRAAAAAGRPFR